MWRLVEAVNKKYFGFDRVIHTTLLRCVDTRLRTIVYRLGAHGSCVLCLLELDRRGDGGQVACHLVSVCPCVRYVDCIS